MYLLYFPVQSHIINGVLCVDINLELIFACLLFALLLVFALLCLLGAKTKKPPLILLGNLLRFVCLQGLLGLAFMFCFALFVKNGIGVSPSTLGVAFIPFAVLAHFCAWHFGVLSASAYSLLLPLAYSLFLLWRLPLAKGGLGFLSYILFNPSFGFIGSQLKNSPLYSISALLPLLCAVIGRGLAVKTIDNDGKI